MDFSTLPFLQLVNVNGIKAVVCVEHNGCHTLADLDTHLARSHSVASHIRTRLVLKAIESGLAVNRKALPNPPDGGDPIDGLEIQPGFKCDVCGLCSVSRDKIRQHCRQDHDSNGWREVKLQSLWAAKQHLSYFAVETARPVKVDVEHKPAESEGWKRLTADYGPIQSLYQPECGVVPVKHKSEHTPWLARTGYPAFLSKFSAALRKELMAPVRDDVNVKTIGDWWGEMFDEASRVIQGRLHDDGSDGQSKLTNLAARELNTFRRADISQDPIHRLQNKHSADGYKSFFSRLLAFAVRAMDHVEMFSFPGRYKEATAELLGYVRDGDKSRGEQRLLDFVLELMRQDLNCDEFSSPVTAFMAFVHYDNRTDTWRDVGSHTKEIAQVLYGFQSAILVNAVHRCAAGEGTVLDLIRQTRNLCMLNDLDTPATSLGSLKLFGSSIAKTTVGRAQVGWSDNYERIDCGGLDLTMSTLRMMTEGIRTEAETILMGELCFGLAGVPVIKPSDLVDNWSPTEPGYSVLLDPRNERVLQGTSRWLLDHFPAGEWTRGEGPTMALRGDYADSFLQAVQRFLHCLMVLIHFTSGQPARRPEMMGLRWANVQADKRNLFVHDGQLLTVITYHKSQAMISGSRFPARFLTAGSAKMLLQYLAVVMPFQRWLAHTVGRGLPNEYLWTKDGRVWPEDQMSNQVKSLSTRHTGQEINVKTWRQMAVAIVRQKLDGVEWEEEESEMVDGFGGGMDTVTGMRGSIPAAAHWQASHNPRTGNMVYGGSVDFNGGLTDAGLSEFRYVSRAWQAIVCGAEVGTGVHKRGPDLSDQLALKRPKHETGSRPRWSHTDIQTACRSILPSGKEIRPEQWTALNAIANNRQNILVVMGTGQGKSLIYQAPAKFRGARTTILVVPLVALKSETYKKCKALGLNPTIWDPTQPPTSYPPLLIVSVEQVSTEGFMQWAIRLSNKGGLDRVVLEEAHTLGTASDYRPKMLELDQLRKLSCQMVLLTGTLPPSMRPELERTMLLEDVLEVRGVTDRDNITYLVERVSSVDESVLTHVTDWREAAVDTDWLCIVLAPSRSQADSLGLYLETEVYHSQSGGLVVKRELLERWATRQYGRGVLVATEGSLTGLDKPEVQIVIHVGAPIGGAITFAQDGGRAGRSGPGTSLVILDVSWRPSRCLAEDMKVMHDFLETRGCRRMVLSGYLDGRARTCSGLSPCDNCESVVDLVDLDTAELEVGAPEELEVDALEELEVDALDELEVDALDELEVDGADEWGMDVMDAGAELIMDEGNAEFLMDAVNTIPFGSGSVSQGRSIDSSRRDSATLATPIQSTPVKSTVKSTVHSAVKSTVKSTPIKSSPAQSTPVKPSQVVSNMPPPSMKTPDLKPLRTPDVGQATTRTAPPSAIKTPDMARTVPEAPPSAIKTPDMARTVPETPPTAASTTSLGLGVSSLGLGVESPPWPSSQTPVLRGFRSALDVRNMSGAWDMDGFRRCIDGLQGLCVLCLLEKRGPHRHPLEACPGTSARSFLRDKMDLKPGWVESYTCCYRCFMPQFVCDHRGKEGCEYKDMVLPMCWWLRTRDEESWRKIRALSGGEPFAGEIGSWMRWLGKRRKWNGETANNSVQVCYMMALELV